MNGDNGAGGAVYSLSKLTIENSTRNNNFIIGDNGIGGALYSDFNVTTIVNVVFSNNTVIGEGAAIHLLSVTLNISGFLDVHNNIANTGVLYKAHYCFQVLSPFQTIMDRCLFTPAT